MTSMVEKFSEGSRRALSLASEEAQRLYHNYIGTEHLLLGLIRDPKSVCARVLTGLGVKSSKVRAAIEFSVGRGEQQFLGEVGLTPRTKKVIELAVSEARQLNHTHIEPADLLVGLLQEGKGFAAATLDSFGVTLEKVRAALHNFSDAELRDEAKKPEEPQGEVFAELSDEALDKAIAAAQSTLENARVILDALQRTKAERERDKRGQG